MFFITQKHASIVRKINELGVKMLSQDTKLAANRAAMASTALDDYCTSPFKTFLSFIPMPTGVNKGFDLRYKAFIELDKLTVSFNKDVKKHKKEIKEIEAAKPVEGKMPYLIDRKFQALNKRAEVTGYDLQKNEYSTYRMLLINAWFSNYKPSRMESWISLLPGTNEFAVRKAAVKTIDEISSNLEAEYAKKLKAAQVVNKDEKQAGEAKDTQKRHGFFNNASLQTKKNEQPVVITHNFTLR